MQRFEDAWEESRTCGRRAPEEEVKRGDEADQDTRPLDPGSSSVDPDPKRFDRRGELGKADGRGHFFQNTCSHPLDSEEMSRRKHELQET